MRGHPTVFLTLLLPACLSLMPGRVCPASLIDKSPFLPPGFDPPGQGGAATVAPAGSAQLQFKGVYELRGQLYFNVYDVRQQKGSWVSLGQTATEGTRVVRYERESDTLVVNSGGQQLQLEMMATSDQTLPVATASLTPGATPSASAPQQAPSPLARRRVIRPTAHSDSAAVTRRVAITPPTPGN